MNALQLPTDKNLNIDLFIYELIENYGHEWIKKLSPKKSDWEFRPNNEIKASSLPTYLLKPNPNNNQEVDLKLKNGPLTGFFYPRQIQTDADAVAINLGVEAKSIEQNKPEAYWIKEFKKYLSYPNSIITKLGKITIITDEINSEQNPEKQQKLAQEYISELSAQQVYNLNRQSTLFGSNLFTYGNPFSTEQQDIVIIWFCKQNTIAQFIEHYDRLISIFCFHQKIVKLYQQNLIYYNSIKEYYKYINTQLEQLKDSSEIIRIPKSLNDEDLLNLQRKLTEIPTSAYGFYQSLSQYEKNYISIETNYKNYQIALEKIQQKTSEPIDLKYLDELDEIFQIKMAETQQHIKYFKTALSYSEQAISAIRGIVEIEQQKQERSLERTIQILGISLGTGGIAASSISNYVQTPITPKNFYKHPAVIAFSLSLLLALLGAMIGWFLTGGYHQIRKNPRLRKLSNQKTATLPPSAPP